MEFKRLGAGMRPTVIKDRPYAQPNVPWDYPEDVDEEGYDALVIGINDHLLDQVDQHLRSRVIHRITVLRNAEYRTKSFDYLRELEQEGQEKGDFQFINVKDTIWRAIGVRIGQMIYHEHVYEAVRRDYA